MTREEAVNVLGHYCYGETELFQDRYGASIADKVQEALDTAITALNGDLGWGFIIFMLEKNYPEDIFGGFNDLGGRTLKAIRWLEKERAALRGWVKTADRLPTEADANKNLCVLAMVARDRQIRVARYEELYAKEFGGAYYFSHWMTLPEVEE